MFRYIIIIIYEVPTLFRELPLATPTAPFEQKNVHWAEIERPVGVHWAEIEISSYANPLDTKVV